MGETAGVSLIAILPELFFVLGAIAVLLVDVTWKPALRVHAWISAAAVAGASGALFAQWREVDANSIQLAYGDMILLDYQGILFKGALIVVAALGLGFGWTLLGRLGRKGAEAIALVMLSATGFMFMVSSFHFLMLFLALEVGSISLYVLAGISNESTESDEAAMKYFLLGSVASAILLYGVALFYTASGYLTYTGAFSFISDLNTQIVFKPAVVPLAVALVFVGLLFKIAAAPFHAWAPDVYQGAPAGITGYMAAAAKIGAIGAIGRLIQVAFRDLPDTWAAPLAGVAAVSVVLGTLYALVQSDLRRILAYSGVAHAGFLLVGISSGGIGARGVVFYILTYSVVLVASFGLVGQVSGAASSGSPLDSYRGLSKSSPGVAAALSVLMLALAGMPATTGFVAKFGVFTAAWAAGQEWLVILALLASVAAFAFYLRVIVLMYFEDGDGPTVTMTMGARISLAVSLVITLGFGIYPTPLLELIDRAVF